MLVQAYSVYDHHAWERIFGSTHGQQPGTDQKRATTRFQLCTPAFSDEGKNGSGIPLFTSIRACANGCPGSLPLLVLPRYAQHLPRQTGHRGKSQVTPPQGREEVVTSICPGCPSKMATAVRTNCGVADGSIADEDEGEDGPPSYVRLLGIDETRRRADSELDIALHALSSLPHADALRALATFTVRRDH